MSGLLLDTHAFVWWATASPELPSAAVEQIAEANVHVSVVSLWELVLKESTKHPMVGTDDAYRWFSEAMGVSEFILVSIEPHQIGDVQHLPMHHRDPFDRLLIAQAADLRLQLLSRDRQLSDYDIEVIWPT